MKTPTPSYRWRFTTKLWRSTPPWHLQVPLLEQDAHAALKPRLHFFCVNQVVPEPTRAAKKLKMDKPFSVKVFKPSAVVNSWMEFESKTLWGVNLLAFKEDALAVVFEWFLIVYWVVSCFTKCPKRLFSWNWTVLNEHKSQVVHFHQPPLDLRFLPGKSGRLHHVAWDQPHGVCWCWCDYNVKGLRRISREWLRLDTRYLVGGLEHEWIIFHNIWDNIWNGKIIYGMSSSPTDFRMCQDG